MIEESNIIKKIRSFLKSEGYQILDKKTPRWFTYKPEIFAIKNKGKVAFFLRQSNFMPELLVQRISSMKLHDKSVTFFIIFSKKPNKETKSLLSLYGIKHGVITERKINEVKQKPIKSEQVAEKKDRKRNGGKAINVNKMPRTDIFISSHQEITERHKAKKLIEEFFPTHKIPYNPILVEEDSKYTYDKTARCINDNLRISELFLGILAEEYRPWVNKEIKKIFRLLKPEEIIIFVKSNKKSRSSWFRLLKWIDDQKSVKFQDYTDLKEFERKLEHCLMLKAKKIHDDLGIPFMVI